MPLYIIPCQIFSRHGTQVVINPQFSGGSENKIIWQISSILTQVEKVCQLFEYALKNDKYWLGWILIYFTRCFFNSHIRSSISM